MGDASGEPGSGPGSLTIANGGVVNAAGPFLDIGDAFTGTSVVTVTGAGSTLNVATSLAVGTQCGCEVGTLTIANGAVVNSPVFTGVGAGSTLNLGIGGLAGSIVTPAIVNDGQIVANFTDSLTLAAAISGFGTLSKAGSGTLTLSGISAYTGATTVNGGTLSVTGSIASSSGVTVNAGTLNGTGTVSKVTINAGGTLAPGLPPATGTLNITGNLVLTSAATYLVQVTPGAASRAAVSGTASLDGTLNISVNGFTPGKTYTLLTATGGLGGTTFNSVVVTGPLASAVKTTAVAYDANDVFLTLTQASLASVLPPGLSGNQTNVANAINAFINTGAALPPGFQNLFALSPSQLARALTQLSGQNNAGGGQQAGFQMTNEFLLLMLNPFDADRGGGGFGAGGGVSQFAPERGRALPPEIAQAYAAVTPASERSIPFAARWNVWAMAFGGANNTSGDPNGTGSANFSARTAGIAAGLDYKLSPDTLIGFALAGGGTSWSLAQGLGGGRSDVFQAGLYGSQKFGPWYLSGAVSFANYWASTTRMITLPTVDTLNAGFTAQSWGGRAEAGYRIAWAPVNLAPYVALQAQTFSTPNYAETATSGSQQFALSYASHTGNVLRSELGSWLSRNFIVADSALVTAFGRAAWAHDWQDAPQASATFLGLAPVASFVVGGAKPAADLAVMTAGAEIRMASGWALMGKFDGEFGQGTQTYVGTARARYAW